MNKFGIAVALVAVVVGLVAITLACANPAPKHGGVSEEVVFEQESGELERPRHRGPVRGPYSHVRKPEHKPHPRRHPPRRPHCEAPEHGQEFEGEEFREGVEFSGEEREFGRGGFEVGRGHEFDGEDPRGSFKSAGAFGGFKKEKEFDAGVRGSKKNSNRNQFAKQKTVVGAEQKAFNAGGSSSDVSTVEGVHKHKNLNNDRLVVKETQRGTEDVDAFRGQSERHDEGHLGASDTKVFGAQAGESGSSEHDSERDFEAGVHKKNSVGAVGGAGVSSGRF